MSIRRLKVSFRLILPGVRSKWMNLDSWQMNSTAGSLKIRAMPPVLFLPMTRVKSTGQAQAQYADAAIFSFHPVKHIAAGEGGMITCNSQETFEKLKALRSHGIVKQDDLYTNDKSLAFGAPAAEQSGYPGLVYGDAASRVQLPGLPTFRLRWVKVNCPGLRQVWKEDEASPGNTMKLSKRTNRLSGNPVLLKGMLIIFM